MKPPCHADVPALSHICSACSTVLQDTLAELGVLGLVPYLERRLSPCQQYHEQPQQQQALSQSPGVT